MRSRVGMYTRKDIAFVRWASGVLADENKAAQIVDDINAGLGHPEGLINREIPVLAQYDYVE